MKGTILLNYNENTRQVEEEEKSRFLREILIQCFENTDVAHQIENIWSESGPLPVEQKVKMRTVLTTYGIQVIDDRDGHMSIFFEDELIGEWFKCTYKLKKDLHVRDPRKRIYLEMEINYWSTFEDPPKEQEIE